MKKIYYSLIGILFFAPGFSQTVVLNPVQDNSIYQNLPGNSNGAGVNIFSGRTATGFNRRAMLKFDLSAIPANATITSVSLSLNCNRVAFPITAYNMSLHLMLEDWGEGTSNAGTFNDGDGLTATTNDATWPCAFSNGAGGCTTGWTTTGGVFSASASATSSVADVGPYSWTSTQNTQLAADVQGWLTNPATNFGWMLIGDEVLNRSAKRFGSREQALTADMPALTVTYTAVAPVVLSYFKGQAFPAGNLLSWQTEQETNNAYFDLQHSLDGVNYSSLKKINGAGTSSLSRQYQFTHATPLAGKNFYRLMQFDLDGRSTLSQVVLVNSRNTTQLLISPNPVQEVIRLNVAGYYTIIDGTGKVVLKGAINTSDVIEVSFLIKGIYGIRVTERGGAVKMGRFIKE